MGAPKFKLKLSGSKGYKFKITLSHWAYKSDCSWSEGGGSIPFVLLGLLLGYFFYSNSLSLEASIRPSGLVPVLHRVGM